VCSSCHKDSVIVFSSLGSVLLVFTGELYMIELIQ
jgi:hypothetical protein